MGLLLSILVVAHTDDAIMLSLRELRHLGYKPQFIRVDSPTAMQEALKRRSWDIIIADYEFAELNGLAALRILQCTGQDIPFIMVSGEESQEAAVASIRAGAEDYIARSGLTRLVPAIERALTEAVGRQEKRKAEEALHNSERFISSTLDSLATHIAILDRNGVVLYTNQAWRAFAYFQYKVEKPDMLHVNYLEFCRQYDIEGGECNSSHIMAGIQAVIRGDSREFSWEFCWYGVEQLCWLEMNVTKFVGEGPVCVVVAMNEITERKELERQLAFLGSHDVLTGVFNRSYFETALQELSHPQYTPVTIITCDVNGLKLINDTLGSDTGDVMLMMAAGVFRDICPDQAVVARTGGDEFSVIIPNSTQAKAEMYCHEIRQAVAQYNSQNNQDGLGIALSLSTGFAVGGGTYERMVECFRAAENNMQREKLHNGQSARSAIVNTVKKLLEVRDFVTEGHASRMQDAAARMGEVLNLPENRIADIRLLAQFHDIGKVGIPDRILFKPGVLSEDEFTIMKRHSDIGYRIAQSALELLPIAEHILKHHERWDGTGYPLGLKENDIPLECRLLSIVDSYDAMTSDRPYRNALTHEAALSELRRCAGTQFDPELVEVFINLENYE